MKKTILSLSVLFLFITGSKISAQVQLVKDVNTASAVNGANPIYFLNVGGTTYFNATDGSNGGELWKSDGTTVGTVMVKDIYPGSNSGGPGGTMVNIGSTIYFWGSDGSTGSELWKSDGTAAGTVLVKDINPGTAGSSVYGLAVMNGNVYFQATDGVNGTELWKSDGTSGGTVMVKDINPGLGSSNPYITAIGNTLYISATDGTAGYELWKSDGSTLGTSLVKDINPGAISSSPTSFVSLSGTVYFFATEATTGKELWKTNGTTIGTSLVKDIYPGVNSSVPFYDLIVYNSVLAFTATNGTNGSELWTSNGTLAGTTMVIDINAGAAAGAVGTPVISNNILFFTATTTTNGSELWISDGTGAGTGLVKDIIPGATGSSIYFQANTDINGTLYFSADNGTTGRELWRSDGTVGGTVLIKDIFPGSTQSFPNYFVAGSGFTLFQADNGTNGTELWKSDGSLAGTILLKNIRPDVQDAMIENIIAAGSNVFFSAYVAASGQELWKSDGTTVGTAVVKEINPGINSSTPEWITAINSKVYFAASDGSLGGELWVSDGTSGGTSLVKDIQTGLGGSFPESLVNVNDTLYLFAYTSTSGTELWKSDGTSGGTVLVKDINPGNGGSAWSGEVKNINGKTYMAVQTPTMGVEPWISNGTAANTVMVKNIHATAGSDVNNFTYCNGLTYFGATDGVNGYELWKSDGTTAGTSMVKDIRTGSANGLVSFFNNGCMSSCQVDIAVLNNEVYFIADDGSGTGRELWKSNGTSAGTVLVKDVYPGSQNSNPFNFLTIGNLLYFTANDGTNGIELWKTDGTTIGTVIVKDINSGSAGSSPDQLTNFGGKLFFSAADGYGAELWTSMGTSSTTARVSDIYPGAGSATPELLTANGNTLFFTANDGTIGTELYKLGMPATLASVGTQTNVSCSGSSNGAINLSVSGGTLPYAFAWSNLATSEDISGLTAGVYSVTVSDAWGWTSVSSFTVTEPNVLSVSSNTVTPVTCNGGNNGAISLTISGGTSGYTFAWSNSSSSQNISGLAAGNYSVLVTDSKGCTTTFSTSVGQPNALSGTTQANDPSCFGSVNGNATVNMTVGVPNFSYQWSATAGSQTTQMASNLAQGSYSVLVTDGTGCTISFTVTLNQPAVLSMSLSATPDTCGLNTGSATVNNPTGGTPGYNYAWSGGGINPTKSNLASGTHTVTLSDSKGCILTNTVTVNSVAHEPIPICLVTVDSTSTDNIVYWDKTTYASVDSFVVYREVSTNIYSRIGAVSMDSLSQFVDKNRSVGPANGDPNIGSYRYKLRIRDVCGNYSAMSPYHNTVYFLDNQNGSFTWNTYLVEGQGSTPVVNFNLLRDTLVNGNWQAIGVVAGTQTTLNDPNYMSYQNTADWRVEATGFTCTPTLRYATNSLMATIVKSKSNITNNRTTGVTQAGQGGSEVFIYPNPNNGTFTLELKSASGQAVTIFDAGGKLVYSDLVKTERQLFTLNFLAKGIYSVVIKGEKEVVIKKLVIL